MKLFVASLLSLAILCIIIFSNRATASPSPPPPPPPTQTWYAAYTGGINCTNACEFLGLTCDQSVFDESDWSDTALILQVLDEAGDLGIPSNLITSDNTGYQGNPINIDDIGNGTKYGPGGQCAFTPFNSPEISPNWYRRYCPCKS